jgi:hypothetical protein
MVLLEALMISCIIDAKEGRDVVMADIPGAFMQTEMDQVVYMQIDGVMADLFVNINPNLYSKYSYKEGGKMVMYMHLKKVLYGAITASLLFWKDLSAALIDNWGFKRNDYD